jgi:hypothetical protein
MKIVCSVLVVIIVILLFKMYELWCNINDAISIMERMRKEIDFWRDNYNILKLKNNKS